MAQLTQPPRSSLLELADELLIGIVEYVESKHDLCNLARACSRLQGLAEQTLYQSILIRKGLTALRLFGAILSRPVRASFVRQLHVRYLYAHKDGIEVLNEGLRKMCGLQELTIEAPCCNDTHATVEDFESKGLIDYADFFIFASSMTLGPQPRVEVPLQTFTLHSHNETGPGREAFNMGRNSVIFLHPTLRNLTVSCFDIGEDIVPYLSASQNATPLKSLTFDECNITVAGFTAILKKPKALEKLTVGERMYHLSAQSHNPLAQYPSPFFDALALQKDSLQYLKHVGGPYPFDDSESCAGLSMGIFPNMRKLEMSSYSIFNILLSQPSAPYLPNIYLRLFRRIWNPEPAANPLDANLVEKMILDKIVLQWILRYPRFDFVLDSPNEDVVEVLRTDTWRNAMLANWKIIVAEMGSAVSDTQNVAIKRHLRILLSRRGGFIPPYMYGEQPPVEEVIFDSDSRDGRELISE